MDIRPPREHRVFHDGPGVRLHQAHFGGVAATTKMFHPASVQSPSVPVASHQNPETKSESKLKSTFGDVFDIFGRLYVWLPLVVMSIMAIFFVGSGIYFSSHALPGTMIAGRSVAFKSQDEIKEMILADTAAFRISVDSVGQKLLPKNSEIGITYDVDKTLSMTMQPQKTSIWRKMKFWQENEVSYQYSFDETKASAYFASITKSIDQPSKNAIIEIKDGEVSITPEVREKVSGIPGATDKLKAVLPAATPTDFKVEVYEDVPAIVATDLEPSKAQIQTIISTPIELSVNGKKIYPTKDQVGSWIVTTPNVSKKGVDISVDSLRVSSYIDDAIAPYVKPPRSRVIIKNPDGTERELTPGEDGVDVVDKKSVVNSIAANLKGGNPIKLELPVAFAARSTITAGEYDKWIEVDLTNHRMYAYEREKLVRTFLTTAGATATPTVKGEFKIQYKVRRQDMRGFNADGSKYTQANVEYINYFYQDYAIHGNWWRPAAVFGNTNTSHGCVSVVNTDAAWIYEWAPVGTSVVIHN